MYMYRTLLAQAPLDSRWADIHDGHLFLELCLRYLQLCVRLFSVVHSCVKIVPGQSRRTSASVESHAFEKRSVIMHTCLRMVTERFSNAIGQALHAGLSSTFCCCESITDTTGVLSKPSEAAAHKPSRNRKVSSGDFLRLKMECCAACTHSTWTVHEAQVAVSNPCFNLRP